MTRRTQIAALLLILVLVAAGTGYYLLRRIPPAPSQTPPAIPETTRTPEIVEPSDWNTYHGDSTLTGVARGTLPGDLTLLWRFKAGAPVRQTPVAGGGRIFFVSARGEVIATDFLGQKVWSVELVTGAEQNGEPVRERIEAPIAYFDGMVLVGTMDGNVYALDAATGAQRWRSQIDSPVYGTPNYLQQSGRKLVYVLGRADAALHCLEAASGRMLWKTEAIERCDGSPSVSADAVVFGSCAAALHVFSPETGALLRSIEIDPDSQVAGGVALDGSLAISGSRSGKVLVADVKSGQTLWSSLVSEAEAFATPAVTKEWVIQPSADGYVYGLDRKTGTTRWRFDTKGMPSSAVVIGEEVLVSANGELLRLRLADGRKVWSFKVSDEITSPAVAQQTVLVGSEDGTVAAFGEAR
jgi:outer membrane protein assembly factor BamB